MSHALTPRTLADLVPVPSTRIAQNVRTSALVLGFALLTAALAQWQFNLSFTPVPITGQTPRRAARRGVCSDRSVARRASCSIGPSASSVSRSTPAVTVVGRAARAPRSATSSASSWPPSSSACLPSARHDRTFLSSVPAMLLGSAVIYVFGVAWLAHDLGVSVAVSDPDVLGGETGMSLGLTPFLIGDALKIVAAGALTPLAWKLSRRSD